MWKFIGTLAALLLLAAPALGDGWSEGQWRGSSILKELRIGTGSLATTEFITDGCPNARNVFDQGATGEVSLYSCPSSATTSADPGCVLAAAFTSTDATGALVAYGGPKWIAVVDTAETVGESTLSSWCDMGASSGGGATTVVSSLAGIQSCLDSGTDVSYCQLVPGEYTWPPLTTITVSSDESDADDARKFLDCSGSFIRTTKDTVTDAYDTRFLLQLKHDGEFTIRNCDLVGAEEGSGTPAVLVQADVGYTNEAIKLHVESSQLGGSLNAGPALELDANFRHVNILNSHLDAPQYNAGGEALLVTSASGAASLHLKISNGTFYTGGVCLRVPNTRSILLSGNAFGRCTEGLVYSDGGWREDFVWSLQEAVSATTPNKGWWSLVGYPADAIVSTVLNRNLPNWNNFIYVRGDTMPALIDLDLQTGTPLTTSGIIDFDTMPSANNELKSSFTLKLSEGFEGTTVDSLAGPLRFPLAIVIAAAVRPDELELTSNHIDGEILTVSGGLTSSNSIRSNIFADLATSATGDISLVSRGGNVGNVFCMTDTTSATTVDFKVGGVNMTPTGVACARNITAETVQACSPGTPCAAASILGPYAWAATPAGGPMRCTAPGSTNPFDLTISAGGSYSWTSNGGLAFVTPSAWQIINLQDEVDADIVCDYVGGGGGWVPITAGGAVSAGDVVDFQVATNGPGAGSTTLMLFRLD
jgi:hypothetical protein